jgi:enamine deaminase RidA (YjgF/YER057c/UK114 family)
VARVQVNAARIWSQARPPPLTLASDPAFTGQAGVLNGPSELLGEIFGGAGVHARSAVGVAVLPLDSPVEVELVVEYS